MNDVLGNHVKDQLCLSFHWPSITLHFRIIRQESINLEIVTWIVPIRLVRVGYFEGRRTGCKL